MKQSKMTKTKFEVWNRREEDCLVGELLGETVGEWVGEYQHWWGVEHENDHWENDRCYDSVIFPLSPFSPPSAQYYISELMRVSDHSVWKSVPHPIIHFNIICWNSCYYLALLTNGTESHSIEENIWERNERLITKWARGWVSERNSGNGILLKSAIKKWLLLTLERVARDWQKND